MCENYKPFPTLAVGDLRIPMTADRVGADPAPIRIDGHLRSNPLCDSIGDQNGAALSPNASFAAEMSSGTDTVAVKSWAGMGVDVSS